MSSPKNALKQLQSVWSRGGQEHAPLPEETKGNVQRTRKESLRSPKHGGVQVNLRITRDEKKRLEMIALREDVSLNEIFSRMLTLYEETHGRVELTPAKVGQTG